jgi:transcriptional regulator with XRE-family HTH domain
MTESTTDKVSSTRTLILDIDPGVALRVERVVAKLPAKTVAAHVGVSPSMLSRIEHGTYPHLTVGLAERIRLAIRELAAT